MKPLIDYVPNKVCNKCGKKKPLPDFYPNKSCKQGVTGTCRSCSKVRINKWYKDNRRRRQDKANEDNRVRKAEAVKARGSKCHDCGESFSDCVYDFHHLDPSKKDVNPSKAISLGKERMLEELSHCVMLCANCHRIRHDDMRKEARDETID